MYANRPHFRVLYVLGGDVRFKNGSGNMAVLCMRNASGHNYRKEQFVYCGFLYGTDTTFHIFLVTKESVFHPQTPV